MRGKGIGTLLLSETKKILRKKHIKRLKVVSMTANLDAVRFYRRMGFGDFASILEMDL